MEADCNVISVVKIKGFSEPLGLSTELIREQLCYKRNDETMQVVEKRCDVTFRKTDDI